MRIFFTKFNQHLQCGASQYNGPGTNKKFYEIYSMKLEIDDGFTCSKIIFPSIFD